MSEHDTRIGRYVSSGLPRETAEIMVAYELSHQDITSTLDASGKRVAA